MFSLGVGAFKHCEGAHRVLRVPNSFLGSFISGSPSGGSREKGEAVLLRPLPVTAPLSPGDEVGS